MYLRADCSRDEIKRKVQTFKLFFSSRCLSVSSFPQFITFPPSLDHLPASSPPPPSPFPLPSPRVLNPPFPLFSARCVCPAGRGSMKTVRVKLSTHVMAYLRALGRPRSTQQLHVCQLLGEVCVCVCVCVCVRARSG